MASLALAMCVLGCEGQATLGPVQPLVINEVVANNEGVAIDEFGETDDYIELYNPSSEAVALSDYALIDRKGVHRLPAVELAADGRVLFWADETPEQGVLHLPFGVSSEGETLELMHLGGERVDRVQVPALAEHRAYVRLPDAEGDFVDCAWASPGRSNGQVCGPGTSITDLDDVQFEAFEWPVGWPGSAEGLVITEAALLPAGFVEVVNRSGVALDLSSFQLSLAPHQVGAAWPAQDAGELLVWPRATLAAGQRLQLPVSEAQVEVLGASMEGVLTLWDAAQNTALQRLDFMTWPEGGSLSEFPEATGRYRFCQQATPGVDNAVCEDVPSRALGDRVRRLLTPDDFRQLAEGSQELGTESVKVMIDLEAGDAVTFLSSATWDLHYLFVREVIEGLPGFDRCDPESYAAFRQGWVAFSQREYFRVEGRRYLLGTLVRHAGTGALTLEFSPGDAISSEQMQHAFFSVMRRVPNPDAWFVRPQTPDQVERARQLEGQLPLLGPNAPFRGVSFQPLAPGVAYGTLRFVAADAWQSAAIGPRDVVVTDQVPLDLPRVAGLITESLQTPLSHVNVLSRARGTPNMALKQARDDVRLLELFDELVRLEVRGSDFLIERADPEEALAFWESEQPTTSTLSPRLDRSVRGLRPLAELGLADLPAVGAKAAQLAELYSVPLCSSPAQLPRDGWAVPVAHSLDHFEASGARQILESLASGAEFQADPSARRAGLERVRAAILAHPVDSDLLGEFAARMAARSVARPLRLRSSSNVEDLAGFNGAGLYLSVGLDAEEIPSGIESALQQVWASLWSERAYDEREYYQVDQGTVAMGVLVHEAFRSEQVNGVAISRNVLDPTQAEAYYVNAQRGEASVTNPAPGVSSEQVTYRPGGFLETHLLSRSNLSSTLVLSDTELNALWCNLNLIHEHFQPLLDPARENPFFAMDVEFKLMGPERRLVIKQARPYSFGTPAPEGWCDL